MMNNGKEKIDIPKFKCYKCGKIGANFHNNPNVTYGGKMVDVKCVNCGWVYHIDGE